MHPLLILLLSIVAVFVLIVRLKINAFVALIARPRAQTKHIYLAAIPLGLALLTKYTALRAMPRLAGRAAARLGQGVCEGCRAKLPLVEYRRMKAEPPEALIQCTGCRRILVRID